MGTDTRTQLRITRATLHRAIKSNSSLRSGPWPCIRKLDSILHTNHPITYTRLPTRGGSKRSRANRLGKENETSSTYNIERESEKKEREKDRPTIPLRPIRQMGTYKHAHARRATGNFHMYVGRRGRSAIAREPINIQTNTSEKFGMTTRKS